MNCVKCFVFDFEDVLDESDVWFNYDIFVFDYFYNVVCYVGAYFDGKICVVDNELFGEEYVYVEICGGLFVYYRVGYVCDKVELFVGKIINVVFDICVWVVGVEVGGLNCFLCGCYD